MQTSNQLSGIEWMQVECGGKDVFTHLECFGRPYSWIELHGFQLTVFAIVATALLLTWLTVRRHSKQP